MNRTYLGDSNLNSQEIVGNMLVTVHENRVISGEKPKGHGDVEEEEAMPTVSSTNRERVGACVDEVACSKVVEQFGFNLDIPNLGVIFEIWI